MGAVHDRDRNTRGRVVRVGRAVADEAGIVVSLGERLGHLDRHGVGEVDDRVLHERHRDAVVHAPNLRSEGHVVERHVGRSRSGVLADRLRGEAARPLGDEQRVAVHADAAGVRRERAKLLDETDDLAGELVGDKHAAERVGLAGLGAALDAVVVAPPTGLGIAEEVALEVHAGAIRPLLVTETLEWTIRLGNGVDRGLTALHGGGLLGNGFDLLRGSGTLDHGTHLEFLGTGTLQKLDLRAELVGLLLQAAERRLLLLAHGLGGSLALGGVLGHRFHLGDDGGQFFEQCLDLVHGEKLLSRVRQFVCRYPEPMSRGREPRSYGRVAVKDFRFTSRE